MGYAEQFFGIKLFSNEKFWLFFDVLINHGNMEDSKKFCELTEVHYFDCEIMVTFYCKLLHMDTKSEILDSVPRFLLQKN